MAAVSSNLISGDAKPLVDIFSPSRQYAVEYYQREYAWTRANVEDMLNDLARSFFASYTEGDAPETVATYTPYFLGPIITYLDGALSYLVDGQQRITTLTLLIIYLSSVTPEADQATTLRTMAYSTQFKKQVFRLNVPERETVMRAILSGDQQPHELDASSANIWNRFQDVANAFPEELRGDALPYFIDWLTNRVILVEITTPDMNMALEIFETMNDRGLQLTSMDMLKSYVLARIQDPTRIERANAVWRETVSELVETQKNLDSDFMKTLLRAQYAQTARDTGKGTAPKDFENIGTAFHKWVREQVDSKDENGRALQLKRADDFERFIGDMQIHARRYIKLVSVSRTFTPGWEHVYFNAVNDFTLQYLLALAVSDVEDSDAVFQEKVTLVTKYVDLVVARRIVNYKRRGYSPMYRRMFALAKSLRGLNLDELRSHIAKEASDIEESFDGVGGFSLTMTNRQDVHYMLGRLTSWLEGAQEDRYLRGSSPKDPFEVEHVLANQFARHSDEYPSETEFQRSRNSFGALLLLPKSFNASFRDMPYGEKVEHYKSQNELAKTLALGLGPNNPNLRRKADLLGESIQAYPEEFSAAAIVERQALYRAMCERIWSLEMFSATPPQTPEHGGFGNRR